MAWSRTGWWTASASSRWQSSGNYDWFLERMHRESGIDLWIVLVPAVGNSTPEQFALATMRKLGIGQGSGRPGLLIVYDTLARTMRVETGPKLGSRSRGSRRWWPWQEQGVNPVGCCPLRNLTRR